MSESFGSNRHEEKRLWYGRSQPPCNRSRVKSLSTRLRKELEVAGFKVKANGDGSGVTNVQGSFLKLFAEPVVSFSSIHSCDSIWSRKGSSKGTAWRVCLP